MPTLSYEAASLASTGNGASVVLPSPIYNVSHHHESSSSAIRTCELCPYTGPQETFPRRKSGRGFRATCKACLDTEQERKRLNCRGVNRLHIKALKDESTPLARMSMSEFLDLVGRYKDSAFSVDAYVTLPDSFHPQSYESKIPCKDGYKDIFAVANALRDQIASASDYRWSQKKRKSVQGGTVVTYYCAQLEGEQSKHPRKDTSKQPGWRHGILRRYDCGGWLHITIIDGEKNIVRARLKHDEVHPRPELDERVRENHQNSNGRFNSSPGSGTNSTAQSIQSSRSPPVPPINSGTINANPILHLPPPPPPPPPSLPSRVRQNSISEDSTHYVPSHAPASVAHPHPTNVHNQPHESQLIMDPSLLQSGPDTPPAQSYPTSNGYHAPSATQAHNHHVLVTHSHSQSRLHFSPPRSSHHNGNNWSDWDPGLPSPPPEHHVIFFPKERLVSIARNFDPILTAAMEGVPADLMPSLEALFDQVEKVGEDIRKARIPV